MAITINIDESNNQFSVNSPTITVPRSPMSGSNLPAVTIQNNTSLHVNVSFTTSPFTASEYSITGSGSVNPTWLASVIATPYGFTVSEVTSTRDTGVRPANGDINIQVMSE
jgi:hypothetical protein